MRLFVAVELPDAIKDELARMSSTLREAAPDAKWVPRDNLHLTLSFLGEVPDERVTPIGDALDSVAAGAQGLRAHLGALGAFPSARRARVLWVALEDEGGSLLKVAEATAEALEPLGFPREARPWTAHVTLARFRTPGAVASLLEAKVSPLAFDLSGLTIYRSRLARPAPRYEVLSQLPRGGA
jgi:2'-5' RNA ligase